MARPEHTKPSADAHFTARAALRGTRLLALATVASALVSCGGLVGSRFIATPAEAARSCPSLLDLEAAFRMSDDGRAGAAALVNRQMKRASSPDC